MCILICLSVCFPFPIEAIARGHRGGSAGAESTGIGYGSLGISHEAVIKAGKVPAPAASEEEPHEFTVVGNQAQWHVARIIEGLSWECAECHVCSAVLY